MNRPMTLSHLLERTQAAIAERVQPDTAPAKAMHRVATTLASPAQQRSSPAPRQLPVCKLLHPAITTLAQHASDLAPLADALRALAPELVWRQRSSDDPMFMDGHANAAIVGPEPDALEQRSDVRVGISLMAPGITYPDHRHPPEEVYIVLSEGDCVSRAGHGTRPALAASSTIRTTSCTPCARAGSVRCSRSGACPSTRQMPSDRTSHEYDTIRRDDLWAIVSRDLVSLRRGLPQSSCGTGDCEGLKTRAEPISCQN